MRKKTLHLDFLFIYYFVYFKDIFDIVESELPTNIDILHKKIIVNPESVNSINDFEYTPVDLALMLNNVQAVKLLFRNGAIENPNCK